MPSVAPGPATSALPGISLEMKSLWPHPRPSEPEFEFSQTPQVIHVHGKFEIRLKLTQKHEITAFVSRCNTVPTTLSLRKERV